jgi:hypothetical protein
MNQTVKPRVLLVHWNREEGEKRAVILRGLGFDVRVEAPEGPPFFKRLQSDPPDAVVIDLSRLPSTGRDIGIAVRHYKTTRGLPLVFTGGDPVQLEKIRDLIPDMTAATWTAIGGALRRAIRNPPRDPLKTSSLLAGYAGAPLVKKLGIRPDTAVGLIDAPDGFEAALGPLPRGVRIFRKPGSERNMTLWFVSSGMELKKGLKRALAASGEGRLWIAWPKKGSGKAGDLTQQRVRSEGLAAGWVDYKICAIDPVWSALLFTRRKQSMKKGKA